MQRGTFLVLRRSSRVGELAALVLALCALGCYQPTLPVGDDPTSSSTSSTASLSGTTGETSEASGEADTTDSVGTTASPTQAADEGSSSGTSEVGPTESGDEESTTGGPVADGEPCMEDAECVSARCFVIGPLGGVCGECVQDSDCPAWGCSIPNPFATPPRPAVCNDGGPGDGCMSDDVCVEGLGCAEFLDIPGVLTSSTCGECADDTDCGAELCSPSYDLADLTGTRTCVAPGTVPNGEGCDRQGGGNNACASGICAAADVMGLVELGVCGECEVDADCSSDQQECAPAEVNVDSGVVVASQCV